VLEVSQYVQQQLPWQRPPVALHGLFQLHHSTACQRELPL
jgi:hypothetical protein